MAKPSFGLNSSIWCISPAHHITGRGQDGLNSLHGLSRYHALSVPDRHQGLDSSRWTASHERLGGMSRVTNVILITHVSECHDEINSVNSCLAKSEAGGGGKFVQVSGYAGGYKHMECFVYMSAFNHADT